MSSLSKFMKWAVLTAVSIFVVAFIGGCGNTEHFAGEWIGYGKTGFPKEMDCVSTSRLKRPTMGIRSAWTGAIGN